MLIKCPECELQVSDKAISCPHCGFVLNPNRAPVQRRKSNKRKRLPNGFGQISEIKGAGLRKPFRAMVTVGKYSNGRPIVKPLKPEAYFETYNDAYIALVEFQRNPYDLNPDITMSELYEKWSSEHFKTLKTDSSIRTITAAWRYCSILYDMRVKDVRVRHLKGCIDDGTSEIRGKETKASPSTKARMKSLFNLMFDYALENEIADRNYARMFELSGEITQELDAQKRSHIPFTESEMNLLWENIDSFPYIDVLLFQCYSGWRPQELGLLRTENIDIDKWEIIGGMKTDAGIDRMVPVHPKIRGIVQKHYNLAVSTGSEYLFTCTDGKTHRENVMLTYEKYAGRFNKIRDALKLNPDHRPHDGRMQFITAAKKYKVDEYAIKYIVGHAINDLTEKTYTVRSSEWLHEEIEKIK